MVPFAVIQLVEGRQAKSKFKWQNYLRYPQSTLFPLCAFISLLHLVFTYLPNVLQDTWSCVPHKRKKGL